MTFQEKNEYCWKPDSGVALDKSPICFKARTGQKEELKNVPDWQNKLRDYIDELINKKPSDL
ncbi:hypothetical protein FM036_11155 [Nostoc sp. HG1]|jgi:hypothetical protein|nr:hypothetical protein [Nostoc sp. HG1]MCL6750990.1 hypothetical protein [Nostoc sp. CCCryo 231-06]